MTKLSKIRISEKQIENAILDYLNQRGIMAWKNQSVGIYDSKIGAYRKPNNKYHRNGVSDIIGIYKCSPLFIEVKTKTGTLTDDQKKFLYEAKLKGAIAFMARSVQEVHDHLEGL